MFPLTPNEIKDFKDFYISYNLVDSNIYGSDTTAIVIGQMEKFYILNGNHSTELEKIAKESGLQGCLDYFNNHSDLINKYSDK